MVKWVFFPFQNQNRLWLEEALAGIHHLFSIDSLNTTVAVINKDAFRLPQKPFCFWFICNACWVLRLLHFIVAVFWLGISIQINQKVHFHKLQWTRFFQKKCRVSAISNTASEYCSTKMLPNELKCSSGFLCFRPRLLERGSPKGKKKKNLNTKT